MKEKVSGKQSGMAAEAEHIEKLLDEALMNTFPASDPVAIGLGQHRAKKADIGEPTSKE